MLTRILPSTQPHASTASVKMIDCVKQKRVEDEDREDHEEGKKIEKWIQHGVFDGESSCA